MSLAGTLCCQDGKPTPFAVCEERCRQGGCQHALPILVNMRKNGERRAGIGISSSVLGGCPRQHVLGQRNEYYEDPEDYYARWFGTFGHYAIEMDGPYPGIIQEVRFYREVDVDGSLVEVSGQPDWIDLNLGLIADHKMVGKKPYAPRPSHIRQLNVYRWLVEGGYTKIPYPPGEETRLRPGEYSTWSLPPDSWHNPIPEGFKVQELEVRYYHPGSKGRHAEFPVPVWPDESVQNYVVSKLRPFVNYQKTGNIAPLRVAPGDEWLAGFCPFRHGDNPGACCVAQETPEPPE